MTATTFTLMTTVPRPRPRPRPRTRTLATAFRAIRAIRAIGAFGGAAAGVVLLGDYGPPGAGVRNPRPEYAPGPD
ncbi:hypothetical protein ACFXGT_23705 [Streptomyces sp. NPDC059352]|uniref:hypothetical protein n=1 Tax=Streptomyces sp. NPDC059352 TaxID=3346810 RepID=UPI0036BF4BEB